MDNNNNNRNEDIILITSAEGQTSNVNNVAPTKPLTNKDVIIFCF
jgi:D-arabinose 5-phosphate isomerase GutQ